MYDGTVRAFLRRQRPHAHTRIEKMIATPATLAATMMMMTRVARPRLLEVLLADDADPDGVADAGELLPPNLETSNGVLPLSLPPRRTVTKSLCASVVSLVVASSWMNGGAVLSPPCTKSPKLKSEYVFRTVIN
jgi:hypothetical protein